MVVRGTENTQNHFLVFDSTTLMQKVVECKNAKNVFISNVISKLLRNILLLEEDTGKK